MAQDVGFFERKDEANEENNKFDNHNDDFNGGEAFRTGIESFVVDAGEQEDTQEETAAILVCEALASDFIGLARVLDAVVMCARLGDSARFTFNAEKYRLYALLNSHIDFLDEDIQKKNNIFTRDDTEGKSSQGNCRSDERS